MPVKQPADYERQAEVLSKHGLLFSDTDNPSELLAKVGYYRLSGYLLPFKQSGGVFHRRNVRLRKKPPCTAARRLKI